MISEHLSSRAEAHDLIEEKKVLLNGKPTKPSQLVKKGDEVFLEFLEKKKEISLTPLDIPLDIVFEDESLLVVNKPSDLVVHPGHGHENDTLVNALIFHKKNLSQGSDPLRPGVVHRLDKQTSGLILFAKNEKAHEFFVSEFKKKKVERIYWALVYGTPLPLEGKIETQIIRHPHQRMKFRSKKEGEDKEGKKAVTFYKVLKKGDSFSWVECKLQTGRTHQIRVHLQENGHPVIGDKTYGRSKGKFFEELPMCLHSVRMSFMHPETKKQMNFEIDWPEPIKSFLKNASLKSPFDPE